MLHLLVQGAMHVDDDAAVGGQDELNLLTVTGNRHTLNPARVHQPLHMLGHGALELARARRQTHHTHRPLGNRRQQM
ncbi:Uncharacterised protein [Mycobacteroides abscessus subsp. massiliense]|nr:Uncharacterised protein [Mycobacteroides abscessus subsp. massiliense]